jgi:hypothetical protein
VNGLENFWSLLKRGLSGTYVSVQPFHLFRYLDARLLAYNGAFHERTRLLEPSAGASGLLSTWRSILPDAECSVSARWQRSDGNVQFSHHLLQIGAEVAEFYVQRGP